MFSCMQARQMINRVRFATAPLTVAIKDTNDNCPRFDTPSYTGQVSQDDFYVTSNGGGRLIMIATDPDQVFEGTAELLQDGSVFKLVESPVPVATYLELYLELLEPQNLGPGGTEHTLQVCFDYLFVCLSACLSILFCLFISLFDISFHTEILEIPYKTRLKQTTQPGLKLSSVYVEMNSCL